MKKELGIMLTQSKETKSWVKTEGDRTVKVSKGEVENIIRECERNGIHVMIVRM